MNFKSKVIFILWLCLVIGLVLFGIIYIIVNQIKVSNEDVNEIKEAINLIKETL